MTLQAEHAEIRCVAASADVCGEGVVWHATEQAVYWTDINRGLLHRHRIGDTAHFDTWHFEEPVTALALTTDPHKLLVVLGGTILLWHPASGRRDEVLYRLPAWPQRRCNDARVAPDGSLWFGTMQNNVAADGSTTPVTEYAGSLRSLSSSGAVRQWYGGLGIQNTIAWTPAGNTLLFGDTLRNELYACSYDRSTGEIAEKHLFSKGFERGLPDGSAMDAEGFLWNCRYGGGCIVRFAPGGAVDRVVETPVPNPTTCAFGGDDLATLYFTSAGEGRQTAGPNDGGLFCFNPGVRGLPCTPFALKS